MGKEKEHGWKQKALPRREEKGSSKETVGRGGMRKKSINRRTAFYQ